MKELKIIAEYSDEDKCYVAQIGAWKVAHGDTATEAIEECLKALENFVQAAPGEVEHYISAV